MNHIQGIDRFQMTFSSLEHTLPKENPVRVIDAFIDKLDLDLLGLITEPNKPEQETKQLIPHLNEKPSFVSLFLNPTSMNTSMVSIAPVDSERTIFI